MVKALIPIGLLILILGGGLLMWTKGSSQTNADELEESSVDSGELIVVRGVEIDPAKLSASQRTRARDLLKKLADVRARLNVSRQTGYAEEMKARSAQEALDKLAIPAEDARQQARLRAVEAAAAATTYSADKQHMIHLTGRPPDGSDLPVKFAESDEATGHAITVETGASKKVPTLRKTLADARRSQKAALDEVDSLMIQERNIESELLELH